MSGSTAANRRSTVALAVVLSAAVYSAWVIATYLLEGRVETFLRPEAILARFFYALVANLLIGIVCAVWVLRLLARWRVVPPQRAGFRRLPHALASILVGSVLGFVFYTVQGPPTFDPVVMTNAFAQVLVGSVAEIVVCWTVVGTVTESLLRGRSRWVSLVGAALVASVLFGVYHFAHSPPFNTPGLVVFLTAIGFVTSLFFFVSRDVYGTIAFHNFLGIFGVLRSLEASVGLASFERPVPPLLVMAVVAVTLLLATHVLWLGRDASVSGDTRQSSRVEGAEKRNCARRSLVRRPEDLRRVDGRAAATGSGASPSRGLDGGDPETSAVSAALEIGSAKTGKDATRPTRVCTVGFPELIEHHPLLAGHP